MHRLVTKNGLLGAHGPLRGLGTLGSLQGHFSSSDFTAFPGGRNVGVVPTDPLSDARMTVLRDTPSNGRFDCNSWEVRFCFLYGTALEAHPRIYFTVYEFISRNLGKSDMSSFVAGGCAGTPWTRLLQGSMNP